MTQNYTSTENSFDAADRTLWLSVVEQAVRDARSSAGSADRIDARRWLTTDGADLRLVCAYAGVDHAYLLRRTRLMAAYEDWFAAPVNGAAQGGEATETVGDEGNQTSRAPAPQPSVETLASRLVRAA